MSTLALSPEKSLLPLPLEDRRKIAAYLESPVSNGLWQFSATWTHKGMAAEVWSELEKETIGKEILTIKSGKRDRRIKIDDAWRAKLKETITSTISFIFSLFDSFAAQDEQRPENSSEFGEMHETVQLVLDIVDIATIRQKYADSISLFKSKIRSKNFRAVNKENALIQLTCGSLIIQRGPRKSGSFLATSWDALPLNDLCSFLVSAGMVAETVVMPIYSPEEEVFAPYFFLLRYAYDLVVPQAHIQPLIAKAMRNFDESNFTDCVSSIGLAAEDVLTQIFETLYREQLTKGLTLGQLVDELNARASARFKKPEDPAPSLASMFPELKTAIESETLTPKHCVELLRKTVAQSIDVQRYLSARLDRIGKPDKVFMIWPGLVNSATNELIRYRNAASHKSRIPIGPTECRRAAHSFVVLCQWWLRERTLIDWTKSPEEILRDCVARYS